MKKAEFKKSFQHFAQKWAKKELFCAISERSFCWLIKISIPIVTKLYPNCNRNAIESNKGEVS
jgi:hypothetical protein